MPELKATPTEQTELFPSAATWRSHFDHNLSCDDDSPDQITCKWYCRQWWWYGAILTWPAHRVPCLFVSNRSYLQHNPSINHIVISTFKVNVIKYKKNQHDHMTNWPTLGKGQRHCHWYHSSPLLDNFWWEKISFFCINKFFFPQICSDYTNMLIAVCIILSF